MIRTSLLIFLSVVYFFSFSQTEEKNQAYQAGEKLKYVIHYGFIRGGKASLSVKHDKLNGQRVHHMILTGRTIGIANTIYRVKDTYESFVDPNSHLPLKAIRNIKEGRYRKYNVVEFDHKNQIASSKLTGKHPIPQNVQDILSAFYYARQHLFTPELKKGDVIEIQTYFADELFPLRIRFQGYETVRTRLGRIYCYKFAPVVQTGRVFKTEDDMTIWVSADKNKLPVRVQFNLFLGAVKCDLVSCSGLANNAEWLKN